MEQKNNRLAVYLPIIIALVLVAGIFIGQKLSPGVRQHDKINDVINYVKQDYVDTVGEEKLKEAAIEGMLQSLDPHSQYISAADFKEANDPLLGNFEGIGVQFRMEKDTIYVVNTVPGGPSEKLGILGGDRIVKIDGKKVAGIKISDKEVMKRLKGKRSTKVKVSILRRNVAGLIDFTITRDVIPTWSIDVAYMPKPTVGYIKLSKFSATTYSEFEKALNQLKSQGMKKLILDLRGNSGGFLDAAIKLADEFLPDKKLIVYTEGQRHPRENAYATDKGMFENGALAVLIDEGSASASEILAGAIQDNDRGTIIGRRSFGKGLVQEQLDLNDGSAIRLTIARYHTPTGRCIQKPYKDGLEQYYNESYQRYLDGEMTNADSVKLDKSLKYKTPKGKTVYGGGGIMPDVYVSLEKNDRNSYYSMLMNKGLIYQFAFDYTDRNRGELTKYKSFEVFDKNFRISPAIYSQFESFAAKKGVKKTSAVKNDTDEKIKNLLKSLISRNLFDDKGFYPIYLKTAPTFLKALEVLK